MFGVCVVRVVLSHFNYLSDLMICFFPFSREGEGENHLIVSRYALFQSQIIKCEYNLALTLYR
jgi:hypothetical protein